MIDATDRHILELLQADANLSVAEIASRVGLSQSPCWRRIQKLHADGVIEKQVALLNRRALGLDVMVFAHVKLSAHSRDALPEFEKAIREFPEVQECYTTLGEVDFILRVVTRDIETYERFFRDHLSQLPAVREVNSMIALSQIKHTTELPLALAG